MRLLAAIILSVLLSGCGSIYVNLGVSHDFADEPIGRNPISDLGIEGQFKDRDPSEDSWWWYYHHNSSYVDGFPWNDNPENQSDRVGLKYRVRIK